MNPSGKALDKMGLLSKAFYKVSDSAAALIAAMRMRSAGVQLGREVRFFGSPIVSLAPGSSIVLQDRVVLCSQSRNTALGVHHPVVLRTLEPNARIVIGADVGISGGSICAAREIAIGAGTLLGANVTIADTDFHPVASPARRYDRQAVAASPVHIGRNVFLGTGTIVLKGVSIGDNSVIGAGSVVSRSIPANSIAAGNPCRVLKALPVEAAAPTGVAK